MKLSVPCVALLSLLPAFLFAGDKGSCPPPPPAAAFSSAKRIAKASNKGQTSIGTVTLLTLISTTGYVCDVQVIQGLNKKADSQAVDAVRHWHFDPAQKDGGPVPVAVVVQVNYELDKDGNIVPKPPQAAPPAKQ